MATYYLAADQTPLPLHPVVEMYLQDHGVDPKATCSVFINEDRMVVERYHMVDDNFHEAVCPLDGSGVDTCKTFEEMTLLYPVPEELKEYES